MSRDSNTAGESTALEPSGEGAERAELATSLRRLDRLANLMDDQFRLPVVDYRIGIDPLLGLIPGGGDWVAWTAAVYILWGGARLGVPNSLLLRMAGNVAGDLVGGYVPVIGDLFDAGFKCNRRNVDLLHDHFDFDPDRGDALPTRPPEPPAWRRYLLVSMLLVGLFILAALPLVLIWWIFS